MKPAATVSIWSAVPTPLTAELKVDVASVERVVEAAVRDGVEGLFVAGMCGEGLFLAGRTAEMVALDAEMNRMLFGIYGGESITCWLTGLKHYLVRRGLFATSASFLGYPLTEECRDFIERAVEAENATAARQVA